MVNRKTAVFDLDDTLLKTQCRYDKANAKIAKIFTEIFYGLTYEQVLVALAEANCKRLQEKGLGRNASLMVPVELYFTYCRTYGRTPDYTVVEDFLAIMNEVFDHIEELDDDSVLVLEQVAEKGYNIILFTSGDELIQSYKIYRSGLYKYVEEKIFIEPRKNDTVYQRLFKPFGYDNCAMIGNSPKHDINPALAAGMNAILVPSQLIQFDRAEVTNSERLRIVNNISAVPNALESIFKI